MNIFLIDGVTTNPKHIKNSGKLFIQVAKDVADWVKKADVEGVDRFPISFEINPYLLGWEEMVEAGKQVSSYSENYVIKVPCNEQGIIAAKKLE